MHPLQQYLPLAVLKPTIWLEKHRDIQKDSCNSTYRLRYWNFFFVGHNFTTFFCCCNSTYRLRYWNQPYGWKNIGTFKKIVATVLTACGIETFFSLVTTSRPSSAVATVLTACGIETRDFHASILSQLLSCNSTYRLRYWNFLLTLTIIGSYKLQQYLPLAVLKLDECRIFRHRLHGFVATVLTACGIET